MYLSILMVEEDVTSLVIFDIGDLQAIGVPNLLRLECGIDSVNFNSYFWFLGLKEKRKFSLHICFQSCLFYSNEQTFYYVYNSINIYRALQNFPSKKDSSLYQEGKSFKKREERVTPGLPWKRKPGMDSKISNNFRM